MIGKLGCSDLVAVDQSVLGQPLSTMIKPRLAPGPTELLHTDKKCVLRCFSCYVGDWMRPN